MEDLSAILSLEVKKEIADRYFRFRKIIEEDTLSYRQQIITLALSLENSIGIDFVCIYSLLRDDDLISTFFDITGLSERFFFECEINTSQEMRRKILAGRKIHGLTKKSRFVNLFFDTYTNLLDHIDNYRAEFEALKDDYETICEQINIFYRNNDISSILQFLRGLDLSVEHDIDYSGANDGMNNFCNLDDKLRLYPPNSVEDLIPRISAVPPLKKTRPQLKKLIQTAWSRQSGLDLRHIQ